MEWLKKIIEILVAYFTRTRRPVFLLLGACVSVLVASLGFDFKASWRRKTTGGDEEFQVGAFGSEGLVADAVAWVALFFFAICAAILIFEIIREFRAASRKRVICVELRGMGDTSETPLLNAIPKKYIGRREDCLIDVRDFLTSSPPNVKGTIARISLLPEQVRLRCGDTNRTDLTLVVGGLMPVPLLFYAGMLLNDGGGKEFFDWERTQHDWKELVASDDGGRFEALNVDDVPQGAEEVVLAVSISYRIKDEHLKSTFGTSPIARLQLLNSALNDQWSKDKQVAMLGQFLKAISSLSDHGVKRIHLVLAASASLSLRIGSAYDRNMPEVLVYQFEPEQSPCYPWSIAMPRAEGMLAIFNPTQQSARQI